MVKQTLRLVELLPHVQRYTYEQNPSSRGTTDHYYIKTCDGAPKVICNMKLKCGSLEGGWMQVVDVDMNREGEKCPGMW